MGKIKVLIVDDQRISRLLFESYVNAMPGFELVKSIESAKLVDIYLAKYSVDLVIMDIVMPDGAGGMEACGYVKKHYPGIKVIAVTSMPEARFIEMARSEGADSFWYKETEAEPMQEIMERTMAGESIYPDAPPVCSIGAISSGSLSDAELAVLRELATGADNPEIAEKLNISVNTVKTHIQHMLKKTGFSNRTELAVEARVKGLVIPM